MSRSRPFRRTASSSQATLSSIFWGKRTARKRNFHASPLQGLSSRLQAAWKVNSAIPSHRSKMMKRLYGFVTAAMLLVITQGCARPVNIGGDYGMSFETARANQVLNPGAAKNLQPV